MNGKAEAIATLATYDASVTNCIAMQHHKDSNEGLEQRLYVSEWQPQPDFLFRGSYRRSPFELLHGSPTQDDFLDAIHAWQLSLEIYRATVAASEICVSAGNGAILSAAQTIIQSMHSSWQKSEGNVNDSKLSDSNF